MKRALREVSPSARRRAFTAVFRLRSKLTCMPGQSHCARSLRSTSCPGLCNQEFENLKRFALQFDADPVLSQFPIFEIHLEGSKAQLAAGHSWILAREMT